MKRGAVQKVHILGGGIAGLACAYYLRQKSPQIRTVVYEAAPHAGGRLSAVMIKNGKSSWTMRRMAFSAPTVKSGVFTAVVKMSAVFLFMIFPNKN